MWYNRFTAKLKQLGLKASTQDTCLFTKQKGKQILIITIYVDDLLLASNDNMWLTSIKKALSESFEMKDIGLVKCCLGIEFHQKIESHQVLLTQQAYIQTILHRFKMSECKPAKTPLEINFKIEKPTKVDEEAMAKYPYQRLIGALIYLAVTTRPDIAFAVNYMSQFNTNYNVQH